MKDFATLPSPRSTGGLTDAETLAWFRSRPKYQNALTMKMRDDAWALVDAGDSSHMSSDQLFWLFKVSLGARKRQAWAMIDGGAK